MSKVVQRRKWQPTPVLLPGKFHGWRNLVGYSPWGYKESDTTEQLHFHFLSVTGERLLTLKLWQKLVMLSVTCLNKDLRAYHKIY